MWVHHEESCQYSEFVEHCALNVGACDLVGDANGQLVKEKESIDWPSKHLPLLLHLPQQQMKG